MDKEKISKKKYQDVGDAVGMPDAQDRAHIEKILLKYDKKHPGEIQFHRDYARKNSEAAQNDYGKVTEDKNSNLRYIMELPPKLFDELEAYIPTLFRSKKHFGWFCKNFKYLMIPKKY